MSELLMGRGTRRSGHRLRCLRRCSGRSWIAGTLLLGCLAGGATGPVHARGIAEQRPDRTRSALRLAQANPVGPPAISVASQIVAEPAAETPLAIQIGGTDSLPRGSYVRIRGMPPSASLSEGFAISRSLWAVPLASLSKLRIKLPPGAKGQTALSVAVVTVEGNVLAEASTTIAAGSEAVSELLRSGPGPKTAAMEVPAPQTARPPVRQQTAPARPEFEQPAGKRAPAAMQEPPAEPVPPPPDPQRSAEELPLTLLQQRALGFITRGQELLAEGNISSARLLFQRAADTGLAYGALFLAQTYDPHELALYKVRGMGGDPAVAKLWYEKAYALGAPEADERLRRLAQK